MASHHNQQAAENPCPLSLTHVATRCFSLPACKPGAAVGFGALEVLVWLSPCFVRAVKPTAVRSSPAHLAALLIHCRIYFCASGSVCTSSFLTAFTRSSQLLTIFLIGPRAARNKRSPQQRRAGKTSQLPKRSGWLRCRQDASVGRLEKDDAFPSAVDRWIAQKAELRRFKRCGGMGRW